MVQSLNLAVNFFLNTYLKYKKKDRWVLPFEGEKLCRVFVLTAGRQSAPMGVWCLGRRREIQVVHYHG